jgi:hypothetical protein
MMAAARYATDGVFMTSLRAVTDRWPTLLALAWAAISLVDSDDGLEHVFPLLVAATGYVFIALVDRPRLSWPVVVGCAALVLALRLLGTDPWPALAVAAAALIAAGLITGQFRRPGLYLLQSPATVGFVAVGLTAVAVPAEIGSYLLAAGLLAHAAWDAVHWHANRIISRTFAEWCGVLDATLGIGILVTVLI